MLSIFVKVVITCVTNMLFAIPHVYYKNVCVHMVAEVKSPFLIYICLFTQ